MPMPYQNNMYHQMPYGQQMQYGVNSYLPYMQQKFQQPEPMPQPVQQVPMPQQQTRGLNGMVVQSVDNVTADCVPMDGSSAFFPKHDLSEIYVKNWCADGTIRTLTFKPISEPQTGNLPKSDLESNLGLSDAITGLFESKFNELSEKIDRLEQSMTKPMAKGRASMAKKEDAE